MATVPFLQGETRKLAKVTLISYPVTDAESMNLAKIAAAVLSGGTFPSILAPLRTGIKIFEVMYNPDKYSQNYTMCTIQLPSTAPTATPEVRVLRPKPETVSFDFLFDATGASPSASFYGESLASKVASTLGGVDLLIQYFLHLSRSINVKTHTVNELMLIWGPYIFKGKLQSATVNYTMFDRLGRPIRATVKATFVQNQIINPLLALFQSPDVTKTYVVKAGDTLPLIAKEEYNDESLYIEVARVNNLKNYRKLIPGQVIVLPPYNKTTA